MSVTSAVVARRPAGRNHGVPRRMAARPAAGQDGAASAASAPRAGATESGRATSARPVPAPQLTVADPFPTQLRATSLGSTEIHVRGVRVRAQRARRLQAVTSPGEPGPVRLTRRGRRVLAGLAMLAVTAVAALLWLVLAGTVQASSHATPPRSAYRGMTQIVVRPGQTLWSIAAAAEPTANQWLVVQQIIDVNALGSAEVHTGELLWVPRA
jgi:nucleoid-associated protein YgaU